MKKKKLIAIVATLGIVSALGITVAAAYDSSEDPLISLSYLRDIFKKEVLEEVDNKIETLKEELEGVDIETNNEIDDDDFFESTDNENTASPTSSEYEVIELTDGDALYAISACEIILRAGKTICIAPDANQGIADLTDASEIYNGNELTKNHLCLIPRGDGRGILAASESVFIMIRGDYTVVEK